MSHFARVINGLVTEVIVAEQDVIDSGLFGDPAMWIQTSYNTRGGQHYGVDGVPDGQPGLRMNYAGIGYTYDAQLDAFIPPRPYANWQLNLDTCQWLAPVPYPQDGNSYDWDEQNITWVLRPA